MLCINAAVRVLKLRISLTAAVDLSRVKKVEEAVIDFPVFFDILLENATRSR